MARIRAPRHMRRLAFAVLLCFLGCSPAERPNIVLITLDTTRTDHLGVYGYPRKTTPNLDRFAQRATVFERAYATSSWTLPSHASIFTGLLPSEHGAGRLAPVGSRPRFYGLARRFETLAELLTAAGYHSAGIPAGAAIARGLGVDQGFESYRGKFSNRFGGYRARWVADHAIAFVERFGADPWFLFVNFFDPHFPHVAAGAKQVSRPMLDELTLSINARLGSPAVPVGDLSPSQVKAFKKLRQTYDAEIRYMDKHLGRVLGAIEKSSRAAQTLVLITSDHGESFGEHYFFLHGTHLYEDNVRVPLIVRWPGQEPGTKRVKRPVQNHQIFATVLEAAGLELPEGVSVQNLKESEDPIVMELDRSAIAMAVIGETVDRKLRAIYEPPYKLIDSTTGAIELYDLDKDPDELENLAERESKLAERLRNRLVQVRNERPALFDTLNPQTSEVGSDTLDALRVLGYIE